MCTGKFWVIILRHLKILIFLIAFSPPRRVKNGTTCSPPLHAKHLADKPAIVLGVNLPCAHNTHNPIPAEGAKHFQFPRCEK
jgi:hypothetical protein